MTIRRIIVGRDAFIEKGILAGAFGRVVQYDSSKEEVMIALDSITKVVIDKSYITQKEVAKNGSITKS